MHILYQGKRERDERLEYSTSIGIIDSLQKTAYQLIDDLRGNRDTVILESLARRFTAGLDNFWNTVQSGKIRIESIALLRVIKNITCRDLPEKMSAPNLDKKKVARDLGLFVNQLNFVLKPKLSNM